MKKLVLSLTALFVCGLLFLQNGPVLAQTVNGQSNRMTALLAAYDSTGQFNGTAIVVQEGHTLFSSSCGWRDQAGEKKNTINTIFQIGSITKQFTAVVILKLAEEGKLKLTDRLSRYYPDFPGGDSITLHQLLTHTSGIYDYTKNTAFMESTVTRPVTEKQLLALFEYKPHLFPAGTQWSYCSSGYILLGCLIQKVTGKTYEQVVREIIFKPIKMDHSGFDFAGFNSPDKAVGYKLVSDETSIREKQVDSSASFSAGAIYSTAGDLLKWHNALFAGKVISVTSLEKACTNYKHNYGYGLVVDSLFGKKTISHDGVTFGFTSYMINIPGDNNCVILLSNTGCPQIQEIAKKLLAVLYNQPYTVPTIRHIIAVSPVTLLAYTGSYQVAPGFVLKISLRKGRLWVEKEGENQPLPMYAEAPTRFFLKAFDAEFEFKTNANGIFGQMVLSQGGKENTATKLTQ